LIVKQADDFFKARHVIRSACRRWRDPQRLVNTSDVAMREYKAFAAMARCQGRIERAHRSIVDYRFDCSLVAVIALLSVREVSRK
jgi:hypothetical protein